MSRAADADLVAVAQVIEPRLRPAPRGLRPFTGEYGRWNRRIDETPDREYAAFLDCQVHVAIRAGERRDLVGWLITAALTLTLAEVASLSGWTPARLTVAGTAVTAAWIGIARLLHWDRVEHAHDVVCPRLDVRS